MVNNINEQFIRTELLLGKTGIKKLQGARVAIFGIGGVGGYVAESLARSGVGCLDLIDKDVVSISNINRQIIAMHSSVGKSKVSIMKERILDINPDAIVNTYECFYLPETSYLFDFQNYDYIVDAVDTVTAKIEIITNAKKNGRNVISSMGAGNKLDPTRFKVADIYDTKVCPLAKVMRKELKKRNIDSLKVVYSEELPIKVSNENIENDPGRRATPGSISFVPSVVGLILSSEVIKDIVSN